MRTVASLPAQLRRFPSTRFMGSKQKLLESITSVISGFGAITVLDLFSGSGIVSYALKSLGMQVMSNDYMAFCACFAKAMVENQSVTLGSRDLEVLLDDTVPRDDFVSRTFEELYFSKEDNAFIDLVRTNIGRLDDEYKRSLALSALVRACLKKRPRGIFTYTGYRYDDGRRDLLLSLRAQFLEAVDLVNAAVFDSGRVCRSRFGDALDVVDRTDLVYLDPPYFSPHSDNEYVRRYHFVEGLVRNWDGVEMQWETRTRKFRSYPTPFRTLKGARAAFDQLFRTHSESILVISYSSNSLPTKDEMLQLLAKYKKHVDVVEVEHRYSVGNQGIRVNENHNRVSEYLFIGS